MKAFIQALIGLGGVLPMLAQAVPATRSAALFLLQGQGAEKELYGSGGALGLAWHFRPGRAWEGRLRTDLFLLGPGSRRGRFGVPSEASSQGLWIGWDFLFPAGSRAVIPFLGVGGCLFRYRERSVPDGVVMIDPANPPVRTYSETTVGLGASAGILVPVTPALAAELRYTLVKHPGAVLFGPVGEGLIGDAFDPSPSHFALGLHWRF